METSAQARQVRWCAVVGAVIAVIAGLVGIGRVGIGRVYLAGAARTMAGSWYSFWHTSFDPGDFLTVEKPPLALWIQALSVRLFGFGGWQVLWPSVVAAAVCCAALVSIVGRRHGVIAAMMVVVWFSTTPGIVALSRSNNADIFVICLSVGAVGAWLRALDTWQMRWWVLSGTCLGFAALAKGLYVAQIIPGLVMAAAWAGRGQLLRTVRQAAVAIGTAVSIGGSFALWMDSHDRSGGPYVAHTTRNSAIEQLFGWGSLQGPRWVDAPGFGGRPGMLRIFDVAGDQAYWMLPFAVLGVVTVVGRVWGSTRIARTERVSHADGIVWSGWLVSCGVVFSLTGRVVHDYYATMNAPAVVALAAIGVSDAWQRRARGRIVGAVAGVVVLHGVFAGRGGGVGFAVAGVVCAVIGGALLISKGRGTGRAVSLAMSVLLLTAMPGAWSVRGILQPSVEWNPVARVGEEVWVNQDLIPEAFYQRTGSDPGRGRWWFAVPTYGYAEHGVARGVPVLAAGGFNTATSATLSTERLEGLLDGGSLRYVVTGTMHPYDPEVQAYLEQQCAIVERSGTLELRRC